ncbi:LPS-assembly lipoprotein LptE [Vibrio stylophorae]|uniref:LPS-assembly lipoprotein LptE n=1 Tax=Vibrio stylophorae TaxID=659351 RepID=A0ABN8DUN6_9VIBR|nr:LPS assembly lipoprotein LptE [Vibrio stylophorae]CAH0534033.1 LPS-assembly lipoprotein LptE [Vibrio stylophorae]
MPRTLLRWSVIMLVALVTSGCGFHLRGSYSLPAEVTELSITSFDTYGTLTRYLKNQIRQQDVTVVAPHASVPNLHLQSESFGERTVSLYQNGRAAEYELSLTVAYSVTVPDMGTRQYSTMVHRNYLDNPLTALAKSVERDKIENEMRQQAVQQIIRQLGRLNTTYDAQHDPDSVKVRTLESAQ